VLSDGLHDKTLNALTDNTIDQPDFLDISYPPLGSGSAAAQSRGRAATKVRGQD
jgi:hypothetical protein